MLLNSQKIFPLLVAMCVWLSVEAERPSSTEHPPFFDQPINMTTSEAFSTEHPAFSEKPINLTTRVAQMDQGQANSELPEKSADRFGQILRDSPSIPGPPKCWTFETTDYGSSVIEISDGTEADEVDPDDPFFSAIDPYGLPGLPIGLEPIIWVDYFEFASYCTLQIMLTVLMCKIRLLYLDRTDYDAENDTETVPSAAAVKELEEQRAMAEALLNEYEALERRK